MLIQRIPVIYQSLPPLLKKRKESNRITKFLCRLKALNQLIYNEEYYYKCKSRKIERAYQSFIY